MVILIDCPNHERFTYVYLFNEQMWVDICRTCKFIWKVYTDEEINKAVATTRDCFQTIKAKDSYRNRDDMI